MSTKEATTFAFCYKDALPCINGNYAYSLLSPPYTSFLLIVNKTYLTYQERKKMNHPYSFMPSGRSQNFASFNLHCYLTQHWKQKTNWVERAAIHKQFQWKSILQLFSSKKHKFQEHKREKNQNQRTNYQSVKQLCFENSQTFAHLHLW